jgi:hypothetical protein
MVARDHTGLTEGFHVKSDGETHRHPADEAGDGNGGEIGEFELGVLVGLLIGEGHFGGDGRQPQITLRMHVRHAELFAWIERTFPGGRLYGPYLHGGRHYLQWMARGPFLRERLLPLLEDRLTAELDRHARQRLDLMRARYAARLATDRPPPGRGGTGGRSRTPRRPGPPARDGTAQPATAAERAEVIDRLFGELRAAPRAGDGREPR